VGGDGVQVLTILLGLGKTWLKIFEQDGFIIWYEKRGDLHIFDFWSYQKRPSEYCLQSAYQDAALQAFIQATEGKFLMPSHRVAIELDRPAITTYAVQPDGTDRIAGLIRPDDLPDLSPDELCRRLGRMILLGSEEGRQLMANQRKTQP
jgi:hypothetical protein